MSLESSPTAKARRRLLPWIGVSAVMLMIAAGVFAANEWFPRTDALTGKRTGWFGRPVERNAPSSWNPIAAVLPSPTPTPLPLSKEYLYAGSRLLAVEDANATAAPPADIAVWRPTNGNWYVMGQTGSAQTTYGWGTTGDTPMPGDFDADGKTDFAIYRASTNNWWNHYSSGISHTVTSFGQAGDIPVTADFDGDGRHDLAVARPNSGAGTLTWWIRPSSTGSSYSVGWGVDTDKPAPADYDGDGIADRAVYRASDETFYIIRSSDGYAMVIDIGAAGTHVVSSDYDGDGKADPAVYVSSTATWYIHQSTTNSVVSQVWGNNGSSGCTGACINLIPVHNDYDLDGKTDLAVWDNASTAVWTIRRSSNGTTRTETFGTTGDIPVPAFYRR